MLRTFPAEADIISLPVVEYWGGPEKVRIDVNPWKWRLSRNYDYITHGIPKELRKNDDEGKLCAALGTDGCDYIHNKTYERIHCTHFYTKEAHQARSLSLEGNEAALEGYQKWFNAAIENLPGVDHYSWYNLERKINTYRNYWSQHWQSLYNIMQEDVAENNMFFDK